MVCNRFKPYAITADIQKAFLQIRILEFNCDALRFHWIKNQDSNQTDILRFTRLVFGLTQSPFVLEATLGEHILKYREAHEKIVEKIAASMYVDDLVLGGYKKEEVTELKEIATKIFQEGGSHCISGTLIVVSNPTKITMKQLNINSSITSLQNLKEVKSKHWTMC